MSESTRDTAELKPGEVFIPGMVGLKVLASLVGLAITLIGVAWLWHPVALLLTGRSAEAQVVAVLQEFPGQEPIAIQSRKELRKINDQNRTAIFKYRLRFALESGATHEALLNYGQVVRPLYSIGDRMRIVHAVDDPADIIRPWDVRTWAFGVFLFLIGLVTTASQVFILWHARRPIVVDPIVDIDPSQKRG
jgi:hypothetical protein